MELIWTIFNIFLFLVALSVIIFLHEMGHFIAAKAVGIRATQFAIGFGQAILSYRKGIGVRIGSTEKEYQRRIREYLGQRAEKSADATEDDEDSASEDQPAEKELTDHQVTEAEAALGLGETEYRMNWIPLGGYVKMLGQEDMDPAARSEHPRSFNTKPIWARFVVISAGVVMNMATAVLFFIGAFMIGVSFPPAIVGDVRPDSPAATTPAEDRAEFVGLQPGDEILRVDGETIGDYQELALASALSDPEGVRIEVNRPGVGELTFRMKPVRNPMTGMLSVGIGQPRDVVLTDLPPGDSQTSETLQATMARYGVKPGSRLSAVDGEPIDAYYQYHRALNRADGQPLTLTFTEPDAEDATYDVTITPATGLMRHTEGTDESVTVLHLLGLVPATEIQQVFANTPAAGKLRVGDVIAQVGDRAWPDVNGVPPAVRGGGEQVTFRVIDTEGASRTQTIGPERGRVGIALAPARDRPYLARVLEEFDRPVTLPDPETSGEVEDTTAESAKAESDANGDESADDGDTTSGDGKAMSSPFVKLELGSGARIISVNDAEVTRFGELRLALEAAGPSEVAVTYGVPVPAGATATGSITLTEAHHQALAGLDWSDPLANLFRPLQVPQRADNPLQAAAMGFERSWMFAEQQYLTIARMIQGSVPVDAANGPVMITAAGARFVERGFADVLWFMGLISVALAVMNFLPIPVVDGGHAVLLLIEKVRGKPLPANVQGAIMLVGIVLLLGVFLFVTYNDITKLMSM